MKLKSKTIKKELEKALLHISKMEQHTNTREAVLSSNDLSFETIVAEGKKLAAKITYERKKYEEIIDALYVHIMDEEAEFPPKQFNLGDMLRSVTSPAILRNAKI